MSSTAARAGHFRYFVVTSHYRKPVNYSRADFEAAGRGLARLRGGLRPAAPPAQPSADAGDALARATEAGEAAFVTAMDDDFNTPDALAALHDLARAINRAKDAAAPVAAIEAAQAKLGELAGVLGVDLAATDRRDDAQAEPFIQLLIDVRAELRSAKQWALADTNPPGPDRTWRRPRRRPVRHDVSVREGLRAVCGTIGR